MISLIIYDTYRTYILYMYICIYLYLYLIVDNIIKIAGHSCADINWGNIKKNSDINLLDLFA